MLSSGSQPIAASRAIAGGSRARQIVLPREHGASGILLIPLVTGMCAGFAAGGRDLASLLAFEVAAIAAFLLRAPLEALLGRGVALRDQRERRTAIAVVLAHSLLAGVGIAILMLSTARPAWLALGLTSGLALAGQQVLRRDGCRARTAAQLAGSVALTSTAAGAYLALTGSMTPAAVLLWVANWMFAANQILFVQLRLRCAAPLPMEQRLARGTAFLYGEFILAALLAAAAGSGLMPAAMALCFVPVLGRGFAWFLSEPTRLAVHRLGKSELAHAITFGLLVAVATLRG